jgi:hypothetical protein
VHVTSYAVRDVDHCVDRRGRHLGHHRDEDHHQVQLHRGRHLGHHRDVDHQNRDVHHLGRRLDVGHRDRHRGVDHQGLDDCLDLDACRDLGDYLGQDVHLDLGGTQMGSLGVTQEQPADLEVAEWDALWQTLDLEVAEWGVHLYVHLAASLAAYLEEFHRGDLAEVLDAALAAD